MNGRRGKQEGVEGTEREEKRRPEEDKARGRDLLGLLHLCPSARLRRTQSGCHMLGKEVELDSLTSSQASWN